MSLEVAFLGQAHVFAVASGSGTAAYQVTVFAGGRLRCDCPAGQRSALCKHAKAVRLLAVHQSMFDEGAAS